MTSTSSVRKGQGDRWLLDEKVSAPHSQYELRAGWVIPGVMISGINSDLPGQIVGQVAQDVYDSATGKYLLIPHGTRVIGTYSSDVAYGQEGVAVRQRLVFPDGKALDLGSMPGADMARVILDFSVIGLITITSVSLVTLCCCQVSPRQLLILRIATRTITTQIRLRI